MRGELVEGTIPADEGGLARLLDKLGPDARRYVETTSGAVWVRERVRSCGWQFQIPDARKVKAIAPLACKTDRVDVEIQTRRTGPRVSASGLGRPAASRI